MAECGKGCMSEREKIIKVIDEWANKAVKANKFDGASVYNPHNAAELADALIAAGIGYIREAKHRVEVAEKIFNTFSNCIGNFVKFQYEQKSIQLDNVFLDEVIKKCLQQAEKELAKEKKQ